MQPSKSGLVNQLGLIYLCLSLVSDKIFSAAERFSISVGGSTCNTLPAAGRLIRLPTAAIHGLQTLAVPIGLELGAMGWVIVDIFNQPEATEFANDPDRPGGMLLTLEIPVGDGCEVHRLGAGSSEFARRMAMDQAPEVHRHRIHRVRAELLHLFCRKPAAACRPRRRAPIGATLGSRVSTAPRPALTR